MSMGVGFFVGFWGLLGPILIWKPWRIAYLSFLNKFTNWDTTMLDTVNFCKLIKATIAGTL